ncbi:MAG: phosphomannomutase/phosphoglucomutase [Actinomycetota bacterium]|nr:phosphomannomutase/phosphoglucomutase [Actinomycetota bacterium]
MPDLSAVVKAYDVRGLVPQQLDGAVVRALGAAFAQVVQAHVVVGHDMRPSSPELSRAFAEGVAAQGYDVTVIGLCSTDGLYYGSGSLDRPGAMFTASHNPAQYNGIKLCRAGAKPVGADTGLDDVRRLAERFLAEGVPSRPRPGRIEARDLLSAYAAQLRSLVDLSGSRPLKVVVDAGNGMAGLTAPAVLGTAAGLAELPLEVVPLYFELDGTFPNHEANPLDPKNLVDLQRAVPAHGADIGLAFDGDADRCFVIDEKGAAVSPSAVTGLVAAREIARELAAGRAPTVLHNLISSAAVPQIIRESGGTPVRTRVGHSYIKAEMAATGAIFGGEHSAHYYFRDFWGADTGMLAALHVLAALGEQARPLSVLAAAYERFVASGEINSSVADVQAAVERVRGAYPQDTVDELDGLTVSHPGGGSEDPMWWFNLRASNTEPLLRLNAEAADRDTMSRVRDAVLALVRH